MHIFSKIKALKCGQACLRRKFLGEKTTLKKNVTKCQFLMKITKNEDFFEKLSKKERARTTTAATTATTEEFSQSIQVPSSTHPGTTYPVRANPSLRFVLKPDFRQFLIKLINFN